MAKIIAFANQKGGVGKTTTCINMSAYLAYMGKRVLIVDIDPQGNAGSGLGIDHRNLENTMYDVLIDDVPPADAVLPTGVPGLFILPATADLAGAESKLLYMESRERVLKKVLTPLRNDYDYITIDCPPSLGLLSINAITAANSVLVCIQSEFLALLGMAQLMNTIRLVKKQLNPSLEIEGFVLTMFDGRSNLAIGVAEEVYKTFGKKVFTTKIPRNIRLGEAPGYGMPIMQYDPKSAGALAYKALTEEFLERGKIPYTKITNDAALRKRPQ